MKRHLRTVGAMFGSYALCSPEVQFKADTTTDPKKVTCKKCKLKMVEDALRARSPGDGS